MKQALASVIANDPVADGVFVIRLEEPDQANQVRPGQFVHVRCRDGSDPLLRRPLSVLRTGRCRASGLPAGQYEVLYEVVGRGTELLSRLRPGDLLDVLGPLGRPFEINRGTRRLLLVGGGVGIVPLVALADEAIQREIAVTLLAGFRSAAKVYPAGRLPPDRSRGMVSHSRLGGTDTPGAGRTCWRSHSSSASRGIRADRPSVTVGISPR